MNYRCRSISVFKLPVATSGIAPSLCDSCTSTDCTNHVEGRKISIMGIEKSHRVIIRGNEPSFVVWCEGYVR